MAFRRVWVHNMMRDKVSLFWELDTSFSDPGTYTYTAEWARSPTGPWTDVDLAPVVDTYFYLDLDYHISGKTLDLWYRVTLTTGSGTYVSLPVRADGGMPAKEWNIAREIVRKEYLHMIKGPGGQSGCLLKRKQWGPRCLECTDYDTADVTEPNCTSCYGTGIIGGYYTPVPYWTLTQPLNQKLSFDEIGRQRNDIMTQVRAVAYPYVEHGDVWVASGSDRRYFIGAGSSKNIQEVTTIRGVPLIQRFVMALAPTSHIVYRIPLQGCDDNLSYTVDRTNCDEEDEETWEDETTTEIDESLGSIESEDGRDYRWSPEIPDY